MAKFFKTAGILDEPKPTLAPDVWTFPYNGPPKLRPEVKQQMLAILTTKVPRDILKSVVIIGSITGYKWSPTSDIDVNVLISPFDPNVDKMKVTQDINNYLAVNTRHPVTFFVQEWTGNKSWQDAKFGVYEVLTDTWLVPPSDRASVRHPSEQFVQEIDYAKRMSRQFKGLADAYFKDVKDLEKIKSENK